MNKYSPEEVTLKFVERINARDSDGLAKLMTEDHTFIDYEGGAYKGREKMRKGFQEYFDSYPEYKIHVSNICSSGDAVAIIGSSTGSHIPPELEAGETLIWTARTRDGLVSEWRIYIDLETPKKMLDAKSG